MWGIGELDFGGKSLENIRNIELLASKRRIELEKRLRIKVWVAIPGPNSNVVFWLLVIV